MPSRLIIVCGLPGSGKTTYAKSLERSLDAARFCADEWIDVLGLDLWDQGLRANVEALQWQLARRLLEVGCTVVIEWGTWARDERDSLREQARVIGAAVELHYLTAPVEVCFERIQRRGMETPPITREQLEDWVQMFQIPTREEAALYDRFFTEENQVGAGNT